MKQLRDKGVVRSVKFGIKLLGRGLKALALMDKPLFIEVTSASEDVIKAITETGGKVRVVHRTKSQIGRLVDPEKHPLNYMDKVPNLSTIF